MMHAAGVLMDKKDYEEPRCPMDNSMWVKKKAAPIPAERILQKEDAYLAANDYAAAEKHLLYWQEEAKQAEDERGLLLLAGELMGIYRKTGKAEKAKEYAQKAIALTKALGPTEAVSGATAYLNAGTVYKAFGEPEQSLVYFEKAKAIYETCLTPEDGRRAGLYNNMGLTLTDLGRFAEAAELYHKAIEIVKNTSKPEEAVTWLNLADCVVAEKGTDGAEAEVQKYLDRAEALLEEVPEEERDSYYAFVCEKCAPVFDYYGYFAAASELNGRAAAIRAEHAHP